MAEVGVKDSSSAVGGVNGDECVSDSDRVEGTVSCKKDDSKSSGDVAKPKLSVGSNDNKEDEPVAQNGDIKTSIDVSNLENGPSAPSEKEDGSFLDESTSKDDKLEDKREVRSAASNKALLSNGGDKASPNTTDDVSSSPINEHITNAPSPRFTQTKGPRAKMTLSPNKAPPTKTIAHYFQAMSKASARKSLSGSFSDKSGESKSIKASYSTDNRDGAKDTAAMKKALDIALSDKSRSPSLSSDGLPIKRQPKARKSFQPHGSSSRESTPLSIKSTSSRSSGVSIANMTIKVPELENALGIKRRSLDKIDAKTFDQIVLAKASKIVHPAVSPCNIEGSPNSRSLLKPLHQLLAQTAKKEQGKDEPTESANISTVITSQKILKKRKRRKLKLGTYKLPGAKKDYKKKTSGLLQDKDKIKNWTKKCQESNKIKKVLRVDTIKDSSAGDAKVLQSDGGSMIDSSNELSQESVIKAENSQNGDNSSVLEASATETDDSFVATDRLSKKKKKGGKLSKWQRGFIPAKKQSKKEKTTDLEPIIKANIPPKKMGRLMEEVRN